MLGPSVSATSCGCMVVARPGESAHFRVYSISNRNRLAGRPQAPLRKSLIGPGVTPDKVGKSAARDRTQSRKRLSALKPRHDRAAADDLEAVPVAEGVGEFLLVRHQQDAAHLIAQVLHFLNHQLPAK